MLAQAGPKKLAPGVSLQKFIEIPGETKPEKAVFNTPAGMRAYENVVYGQGSGHDLKLDLYIPEGKGPFPGIMIVHGGGWVAGTKESFRPTARKLTASGFVVANVEYRLAQEALFPGAVEDCKAAVRWLRSHAAEIHLNPAFIGGVGASAGGHLVAMVALTGDTRKFEGAGGNPEQSSALQAAVIMGASVDQPAWAKEVTKPIDSQVKFFGGTLAEKGDVYIAASPIAHISKACPPLLFLEGELDRGGDRYIVMRKKLDEAGVKNSLTLVQGGKHGCWSSHPWFTPMVDEMALFMRASGAAH